MMLVFAVKFKEWGLPHIAMGGMYTITPDNAFKYNVWDRLVHLLPPALVLVATGFVGSEALVASGLDTGLRADSFHDLILYVFLPVLVFEAAFRIDARLLLRDLARFIVERSA